MYIDLNKNISDHIISIYLKIEEEIFKDIYPKDMFMENGINHILLKNHTNIFLYKYLILL